RAGHGTRRRGYPRHWRRIHAPRVSGHFRRGRIAASIAGARSLAHTLEDSHFGGYAKGKRRGNRFGRRRGYFERYLRAEKRSPLGESGGKIRPSPRPDAHAWHAAHNAKAALRQECAERRDCG